VVPTRARRRSRLSTFAEKDIAINTRPPSLGAPQSFFQRAILPSRQESGNERINLFSSPRHKKFSRQPPRLDTSIRGDDSAPELHLEHRGFVTKKSSRRIQRNMKVSTATTSRFGLPTPRLGRHGTQHKDTFFGASEQFFARAEDMNDVFDSSFGIPLRFRLKRFLATSFTGKLPWLEPVCRSARASLVCYHYGVGGGPCWSCLGN
jgi:hypothetical protein